ncbi:hypothetical protein KM043_003146 [Ampulex compressa]|nr:hypothetical protein KM043_003146 [Ampulex compressa]
MQRQSSKRRRRAIPRVRRSTGLTGKADDGAPADGGTNGIATRLIGDTPVLNGAHHECYHMEKNSRKAKSECEKLGRLLERREREYRELHFHHENLVMVLREAEGRKSDLARINENLKTRNARLSEDIVLLKNVVYRINSELERCQEKHRSKTNIADDEIFAEGQVNVRVSRAWAGVELHTLAPLLNAYEEHLAEKQDLLRRYQEEFAQFGNKCKRIIEENGELRKETRDLKLKCDGEAEKAKTLLEDTVLAKKQNADMLVRATAERRRLQEVCASYEERLTAMFQENSVLRNERLASKIELNDLKGKYEGLAKQCEKMLKGSAKSVRETDHLLVDQEEYKRVQAELQSRHELEKKELIARIRDMEDVKVREQQRLIDVTTERERLKEVTRKLQKDMRRLRRKVEYSREITNSIKASCDLFKQQWQKISLRCKELLDELERVVTEKEELAKLVRKTGEESATIFYLGDTIAKRMDGLKNELKTVQTDTKLRLAIMERHTRIHNFRVHRIKIEYSRKLQRLKHLIQQKEHIIGQLKKEKSLNRTNLDVNPIKPVNVKNETVANELK